MDCLFVLTTLNIFCVALVLVLYGSSFLMRSRCRHLSETASDTEVALKDILCRREIHVKGWACLEDHPS